MPRQNIDVPFSPSQNDIETALGMLVQLLKIEGSDAAEFSFSTVTRDGKSEEWKIVVGLVGPTLLPENN